MVPAPARVPVFVGGNFTWTAQRAPAASEDPQVPEPAKAKSPLIVRLLIVSVAFPVLLSVTACAALAVPTVWFPNVKEVGERLTTGAVLVEPPVPVSGIVCGVFGALSLSVTAPVRVPVAAGVKFTLIVQLAPAATVPAQLPSPANAKSPLITKLPLNVSVELPVLVSVTSCT